MWLLLLVLLMVIIVLIPYRVEPFEVFPETLELTDGQTADLVEQGDGRGEYALRTETSTELPPTLDYQSLTTDDSPGEIIPSFELNDTGIPLAYYSSKFVDPSIIDPVVVPIDPKDACEGKWENDRCNQKDDSCSTGDRVAIYEETESGGLQCVQKDECHTGIWNGDYCELEGDVCSEGSHVHVYVRDGDTLVCTPQYRCNDGWYSHDENACKSLGEDCTIKGLAGKVKSQEEALYCQLDTEERNGFKLTSAHKPVDSEMACYETCTERRSGCGAYSYDSIAKTCATAGLREATVFNANEDTKIVFTPSANLKPVVNKKISEANDSVTFTWEPFNHKDFEMRYSSDMKMESYDLMEATTGATSVSTIRGDPGATTYFRYFYGSDLSPSVFDSKVTFASGPKEFSVTTFDSEPVEGPFYESLEIVWRFTLPEGHRLFIRFPDSEDFIEKESHGRITIKFETPGTTDFECYVIHGEAIVYEQKREKNILCLPSKIQNAEGSCTSYEILDFDVRVEGLKVSVIHNVRTSVDIKAILYIGSLEGKEVRDGTTEVELEGPSHFDVSLVIENSDQEELDRKTISKSVECPQGFVELQGKCFAKCPEDVGPAKWQMGQDGVCSLSCDDPYEEYDGRCVIKEGEPCYSEEVNAGAWLSDGLGGCRVVCEDGYFEQDDKCFQLCTKPLPKRAEYYWNSDQKCEVRCETDGFRIVGDECLQTCPENTDTRHYIHDENGECRFECNQFYSEYRGVCVPNAGQDCGDDDPNGDRKTDGKGGCILTCNNNFSDVYDVCLQDCGGDLDVGTWSHVDGLCSLDCPEKYHSDGKKCVLDAEQSCGDVRGGTSQADGNGSCILTCNEGYTEFRGRCIKIYLGGTSVGQTVELSWTVDADPGFTFRLTGPDVDQDVEAEGSFEKRYSTSGVKEFKVIAYENGAFAAEKTLEITVSCDGYTTENGTCIAQGGECGSQPENGRRYVNADGVCVLECDEDYDGDECQPKPSNRESTTPVSEPSASPVPAKSKDGDFMGKEMENVLNEHVHLPIIDETELKVNRVIITIPRWTNGYALLNDLNYVIEDASVYQKGDSLYIKYGDSWCSLSKGNNPWLDTILQYHSDETGMLIDRMEGTSTFFVSDNMCTQCHDARIEVVHDVVSQKMERLREFKTWTQNALSSVFVGPSLTGNYNSPPLHSYVVNTYNVLSIAGGFKEEAGVGYAKFVVLFADGTWKSVVMDSIAMKMVWGQKIEVRYKGDQGHIVHFYDHKEEEVKEFRLLERVSGKVLEEYQLVDRIEVRRPMQTSDTLPENVLDGTVSVKFQDNHLHIKIWNGEEWVYPKQKFRYDLNEYSFANEARNLIKIDTGNPKHLMFRHNSGRVVYHVHM